MFDFLEDYGLDSNIVLVVLVFSIAWWAVIWFYPAWQNSSFFDLKKKILLSILLPIFSYPLTLYIIQKQGG